MVSLAEGLFGVGILVSLGICILGLYSYRKWDEPGVLSFAIFTLLFGTSGIASGSVHFIVGDSWGEQVVWSLPAVLGLGLWCLPWALFSLQYSGRYTRLSRRTFGYLFLPYLLFASGIIFQIVLPLETAVLGLIIGGLSAIYIFGLVALGIGIILLMTAEYSHLSLRAGVLLSVAPATTTVGFNTANALSTPLALSEAYLLTFGIPAIALTVALFQYGIFTATPAVGTIGEREIAREIDDLVFVVDDQQRIIKINEATTETLDIDQDAVQGEQLQTQLPYSLEALGKAESITLETPDGTRRYDSQVSSVTDQHGRGLGSLVSLHDVTEHELREQRLTVLNRVLRHNLRNKVEVVKSHAEVLDAQHENGHATTIVDTADTIAELGHRARTIDQFVSHSKSSTAVDLVEVVEATWAVVDPESADLTVSFDLPESATVETNREALKAALESSLDNAATYADTTVEVVVTKQRDEYEVTIADNGPGIPSGELASLDAGTETALEHGTGLGLWQLKWAVMTIGGDLEFETTEGTTVHFTVPDEHRHPA
ncbi:ATP-binding protein [Halovenus rubra]|uniref:ATP-binding protein n=2 Tax=Halovenus rubra TaxID=869890 RepID=A0ACC7DVX7_9EURY|nr:ATP-binding protein [Halovenus rubra]